jgi:hypothetical protein
MEGIGTVFLGFMCCLVGMIGTLGLLGVVAAHMRHK